ncbi:MAG: hypothetical protein AAF658_04825, partial [Myxococcota bacterium]
DRVSYEISGRGIRTALTGELTVKSGLASGTIPDIPAGGERTVVIRAFSGSAELCTGTAIFSVTPGGVENVSVIASCHEAIGIISISTSADVEIDSARARVTAPDFTGEISVPLRVVGQNISGTISDVPAGTDRQLTVSASLDGAIVCVGGATLNTERNLTATPIDLELDCGDDLGGIVVDGQFNFFPLVHAVFASTPTATEFESIDIEAAATDPDGDPLSILWTDGTGSARAFGDANTFVTTWDPSGLDDGIYTLRATVSDSITPAVSRSIDVTVSLGNEPPPNRPVPGDVVLNEVFFDQESADGTLVFVEIAGRAGTDLTGYTVVGVNGNGGADYQTISLDGVTIPTDGLVVVARGDAAPSLAEQRDVTGNTDYQNGADSIQLRLADSMVDAIGYGDFATSVFAGEGAPVAEPIAGQSLSRTDGIDTDDNATDFTASVPSPGVF